MGRGGSRHPHLLARDSGVSVGGRAEDQVVEDGRVRSHADSSAHHHRDLELVPVLVAASERTFQPDLEDAQVVSFLPVRGTGFSTHPNPEAIKVVVSFRSLLFHFLFSFRAFTFICLR